LETDNGLIQYSVAFTFGFSAVVYRDSTRGIIILEKNVDVVAECLAQAITLV
jgi:hypothetical protein